MNNNNKASKHFLFYSHLCGYSTEIHQLIIKYNLGNYIYQLNISDPNRKFQIPACITSVPTLLMNDKKTLLKDENLYNFITLLNAELNTPKINDNNLGGNFALLGENEQDVLVDPDGSNFSSIQDEQRIYTPDANYDSFKQNNNGGDKKSLMMEINKLERMNPFLQSQNISGDKNMGKIDLAQLTANREMEIKNIQNINK